MGDSRRNIEFSKFIFRNFLKQKSVLIVADGKGYLALALSIKYKVRVIEAKPRQEIKRKRVKYQGGWFDEEFFPEEDFIVGMHPDEATSTIIKVAKKTW